GRGRQVGPPQEVYEDPVDTFVATFVGQPPMNLLELRDLSQPALPARTLLGFRPEHFLPKSVFGAGEDTRGFRFAVRRVEYLGSDRYVYGWVVEGGGARAAVAIVAELPAAIACATPECECETVG